MKKLIVIILICAAAQVAVAGFGFSEPTFINSNWDDIFLNRKPQLATNGQGVWISVFNSDDEIGGGDMDMYYTTSLDNGHTWSEATVLNVSSGNDSGHDILSMGSLRHSPGMFMVVWDSRDSFGGTVGTDGDIAYAIYDIEAETWGASKTLNSYATIDSALDGRPAVDTDGNGIWICVWNSRYDFGGIKGSDFDVAWSRSNDNGQTWSDAQLINPRAGEDDTDDFQFPNVRTDGQGIWIAAWQSQEDPDGLWGDDYDIMFCRSADNGETWSPTAPLNINAGTDSGDDAAFASPGGMGPAGITIETNGQGIWIATWSSQDSLEGQIGADWDILYSRSVDGGVTWETPKALNSNAAVDSEILGAGDDLEPSVHTDRKGNWFVVWSTTAFSQPESANRNIAISQSTDDGLSWTPMSPLNFTMRTARDGYNAHPVMATDGAGIWLCAWNTTQSSFGASTFAENSMSAFTSDILAGPDPPTDALLLIDVLSGKVILDHNRDGIIDTADLAALLFRKQSKGGDPRKSNRR